MADTHKNTSISLVKRLVRLYLKPYFGKLAAAIGFMVVAAAMTAIFARLVQPVLDDVLIKGNLNLILPIALGVFACFVFRGISTYFHTVLMNEIGQSIVSDVQKDLFKKTLALDIGYFHQNPSGEMVSRMISDVNVMRAAVSDSLTGIGKSFLTLILLIAVMFYQDWKLAIAAFTIFPFAAIFVGWLGKRLRKISGQTQDSIGVLTSFLSQVFLGIRQVKAYNQQENELQRASVHIDKVRDLNIKNTRTGNLSTPVNDVLVGCAVLGLISYGGYQSAAGTLTPGELMSFITAFLMSYEPMKKLAKLNNNLQTGLGAAERVFSVLDKPSSAQDEGGELSLSSADIYLEFKNVSFSYGEKTPVLENINFKADKGDVIALVGPSGAGKSTVINLILRFYDPQNGQILINDKALPAYNTASLRENMALVSQDIMIFDETVLANIAYGKPDASEDEIIEAAKKAHAHEFITKMPEGYNTRLGENGMSLSGGQRQRIAIARAILKDSPLLLLDEATSALDTESEKFIQESLAELQQGRTTIVIAHRLSTIRNATKILVLENGNIIESGTHESLLNLKGLYADLHSKIAA